MDTPDETPIPKVTTGTSTKLKSKGKLVIFDDSATLLARFKETFTQLGYEVIPVYVSHGDYDRLIEGGRFKRGTPQAADFSYRQEKDPTLHEPANTLDIEMAIAESKIKTPSDRHALEYIHLKNLSAFTYAVKSKEEVAKVLREVHPDFVLSDMEMRSPADPDMSHEDQHHDDDTVMGNHIMAITAREFPEIPKAIHTGQYTISDDLRARIEKKHPDDLDARNAELADWKDRYAALCANANADRELVQYHYRIFPKDETGSITRATQIDTYLASCARGETLPLP